MHIVVAPNAFKNSLDAGKVAEAIIKGLEQSDLQCTTESFPVADGGDGTASLLVEHLKGRHVRVMVDDPLGRKISSSFGLIENEQTAVIELADASGLRLLKLDEYAPLQATTFGTGQLMMEACNQRVKKIILCIGGSATVDAGTGILRALGTKFFDGSGNELVKPGDLHKLANLSIHIPDEFRDIQVDILCDVTNHLLGEKGAAAVFGPQKGASPSDVLILESSLTRLRDVVLETKGEDMNAFEHGGAAGGVSAGLHTMLGARLVNGIDYFLEITGFNEIIKRADLVITGEGSIDRQTLHGKGPFGVAKAAKDFSIPVIGMAGKLETATELSIYFSELICINEEGQDVNDAIKNTYSNLVNASMQLGNVMAANKKQSSE